MDNLNLQKIIESRLLPHVENPMRYSGGELNCIQKDLSAVSVHGTLCFPDLYDIGMSHHGLQILYHIVNKNPQWALSRCFQPWVDAEELMRRENIPLYSLEYFRPVRESDWIGFSVQYELQYTNLINMIDMSGLAIRSKDRGETDPLIVAGGPCLGNPEPIAEFVDICVVGDGEAAVVELCRALEHAKKGGITKPLLLEQLSQVQGFYVPALNTPVKHGLYDIPTGPRLPVLAARIATLDASNYPQHPVVPLMDVVHHRLAVEVMRGCTQGCRFCAAGMYYRPVRERDPEAVYNQISAGVTETGWRDVGLLSLSTADYTCLSGLLQASEALKEQYHIDISIPSTRIDSLTTEQLDLLDKVTPASSFTIAPEAASQRLRSVINKNFSDESILSTVKTLLHRNVQTLKLYFMVGLPTETNEDIDAIVDLVGTIADLAWSISKRKNINVAISPFSPKPHTPFQWEAMEDAAVLTDKGRYIKQQLRNRKNVKVSYRNAEITLLETVMARGDRSVGKVIAEAWGRGARFDGWDERFDIARWKDAALACEVTMENYTGRIALEQPLPWTAVSTGVTQEFLKRERELAIAAQPTDDCRGGACALCGACDNGVKNHYAQQSTVAVDARPARLAVEGSKGPVFHYRLIYSKVGATRFLGHLDMVSVFHRAFMAAGIKLVYSQGYHPHPKVSFGPPLPFGAAAEAEAVDIAVSEQIQDGTIVNRWLPPGLRIASHIPLFDTSSLNSIIVAARYRFVPLLEYGITNMELGAKQFLAKTEHMVTIEKGGATKAKNIRPLVLELSATQTSAGPVWEGVLKLEPGATCKPSELIMALDPAKTLTDFEATRTACLIRKNGTLVSVHEQKVEIRYGRR